MTPAQAAAARRAAATPAFQTALHEDRRLAEASPGRAEPLAVREPYPEVASRPRLRVVPEAGRGRKVVRRRLVVATSFLVLLVSLMSVVVARAMIDEGQARLSGLQSQLSAEQARHDAEQLRVAQLETPGRVTAKAGSQHLVTPAQVQQVPSVPLSQPIGSPRVSSGSAAGG